MTSSGMVVPVVSVALAFAGTFACTRSRPEGRAGQFSDQPRRSGWVRRGVAESAPAVDSKQTPPAGLNRVYYSLWYKTNVAVFQPDKQGVRLSPIVDFLFLKDLSRAASATTSSARQ